MTPVKRPIKLADAPRRRRKRYAINKKRLVLSLILFALGVELVLVALTSPQFAIEKLKVTGTRVIPVSEVLRELSFMKGSNIFKVDERKVADLLKKNPVVADVRLHRRLPRTLIVSITERKPELLLKTGTALYDVDRLGIPYRAVVKVDTKLPLIACTISDRITLGRPLKSPAFKTARRCLLLAQAKKVFRPAKITVDQSGHLCLNVRDEFQVKLGTPEQLSRKLDLAEQVVEQIPEFRQRGVYIDVTCPDASALKLAE